MPDISLLGVGVGAVSLKSGMLAEDGALVQRWTVWPAFAFAFYGAILLLVYAHHNWLADFNSPPSFARLRPRLCDVLSAAMMFRLPRRSSCTSPTGLGPARRDAAVGLWHLHPALYFPHLAAIHCL